MRVLIISHLALPHVGGVEVLVDKEIRALSQAGHEVVLITSDGDGRGTTPSYPDTVRVIRVPAWHGLERRYGLPYPLFSPVLLGHLWHEVGRCDCVHVHGFVFMNSALALVAAWLRQRPSILTDHGGVQQFDSVLKSVLLRCGVETVGRLSARLATRLVSYNTRILGQLDRLAGRKAKTMFLANPVERELFHPPTPERRRAARARLGWVRARPKVLFVGRLVPEKGVSLLVGARDPSYDLVFCGPGDPVALGSPPPPDVVYLPPRPQRELIDLYHAADLFVLPTGLREGFPLVIQEALACGLRVITCYDSGYDPYRGLPGLSFCARDPESVRRAIRAALASAPAEPPGEDGAELREFCPPVDVWLKRLYSGPLDNGARRNGYSPARAPAPTPSPPGVAFVNPAGMSVGGVTTWSLAMVRHLRPAGRPAVLLNHPRPDVPEVDPSAFADVPVVPCHSILKAGNAGRNAELYGAVLPATIVPNWSAETYGVCARLSRTRARQMRVVGVCHTDETWYFRLLRYYEPLIHRFVAVSEECGQVLRRQMPWREKDIVVRPYPVAAPKDLSRAYAPAGGPLRLLYAGRIAQLQKRVTDLPRLAQALAARGVNFTMRIVGDGPDKAALAARVRELDRAVRSRVTVEAGVPPARMPAVLEASDVCVLVSEYEGTSIFMLEGMAHGCVPVVTQVSGTAGVIDEGVNGFARPVGDVDGLADAVARLDRDRGLLNAAGTRAARTARRYSYDSYLDWFCGLVDAAWEDEPRVWPAGRPFLPGVEAALRRLVTTFPRVPKVVRWLKGLVRGG